MTPTHTHVFFHRVCATRGYQVFKYKTKKAGGEGISLAWLRRQNRASWGDGGGRGGTGANLLLWGRMEPESHNFTMDYPKSTWGFPHRTTGGLDGADVGVLRLFHLGTQKTISVFSAGARPHTQKTLEHACNSPILSEQGFLCIVRP